MVTADDDSSGKFAVFSEYTCQPYPYTFFYKRVYLHIPLIMYFTCIIRGSSLIKLGSLQDNRNYLLG